MEAEEQGASWIPESCALPTAEQPLRVAEFDGLFAASLRGLDRPEPSRLRMQFDADAAAAVADLTTRETACCSIFTFTLTRVGQRLLLDVTVPAVYVSVLDANSVSGNRCGGVVMTAPTR